MPCLTNRKGNYVDISESNEFGGIDAYVVDSTAENLENWLIKNDIAVQTAKIIRTKYTRITLISGIRIDDEHRWKGHGTAFLQNAIISSQGERAEAILLLADLGERNDFDLVTWYQRWGFEIIGYDCYDYPLMVKSLTVN